MVWRKQMTDIHLFETSYSLRKYSKTMISMIMILLLDSNRRLMVNCLGTGLQRLVLGEESEFDFLSLSLKLWSILLYLDQKRSSLLQKWLKTTMMITTHLWSSMELIHLHSLHQHFLSCVKTYQNPSFWLQRKFQSLNGETMLMETYCRQWQFQLIEFLRFWSSSIIKSFEGIE